MSIIETLLLIVLIHAQVPLNCQKDHISARSECSIFFDAFTFALFYASTQLVLFPSSSIFIDPKMS